MKKLKKKFSKGDTYTKIKMVLLPSYMALAMIILLVSIIALAVIPAHTASLAEGRSREELVDAIQGLQQRAIDGAIEATVSENEEYGISPAEIREHTEKKVDIYIDSLTSRSSGMAIAFGVLVSVIAIVLTVIIIKFATKTLQEGLSKPLFSLVYDIKKANEGLEEIGIQALTDTQDEATIIQSVYFNVIKQLKNHMDDVSKLSGLTEKFENSANFDALTGVYNRRRFFELVQKHAVLAAKKNEATYVIMLDLDKFKNVNDTYGHAAGDEVLRAIATRVKTTVRPYDLFGRYGGEEFVMFISANDADIAISFAERIRVIIQEEPVHFEDKVIPITSSFGIAQAAPDVTFEEALKFADEALYKAKENGRNRVEFYNSKK
ncbi:MAG: GGDEF domain-containing protein [Oscillospiraceae bacterium]|nr:GGDEF domain-containing protein [Oscillospiraceae bacterium]